MKYKDYKAISQRLDENFFTLGLKTPRSLGAVGSKLSEMGFGPDDGDDDASDDGSDEGHGDEGDDMGDDVMAPDGAPDETDPMADDPMAGGDDMGGADQIDPSSLDLDPHLMSLLGLGGLGIGDDGDKKADTHIHHHIHHTMTPGAPGEASKKAPPPSFGGSDEGDEGEDGDDDGSPFGGKHDKGGESDDEGSDDSEGSEDSDSDSDSDSDGGEDKGNPFASKKDKGGDKGSDDKKKFMGKCCAANMKKEDRDFLGSLIDMGKGDARQKYKSGLERVREQAMNDGVPAPRKSTKARREPQAGEVGYAPTGKLGANFELISFTEWLAARGKTLNG